MAEERSGEELSEAEVEGQAASEPPDPQTSREGMEEAFMQEGESGEAGDVGEPTG